MDTIELWVSNYWFWFGVATLLLALEAAFGGFLFLATSVAALAIGGVSHFYPQLGFPILMLFFMLLASATLYLTSTWVEARQEQNRELQHSALNQHYLGRQFALIDPIHKGYSSLNIDGIIWQLRGDDAPAGTKMSVVSVSDGILDVAKITP